MVEGVGGYARLLLNLYQVFVEYSGSQQDDEVCSNSVYGLGVLAANALPDIARLGECSLPLLSPFLPLSLLCLPPFSHSLISISFLLSYTIFFKLTLSFCSFISFLVFFCYSNYPAILQHLFVVNQTRTNNCVKDNVTAAVSRMIMASQDSIPLDQVNSRRTSFFWDFTTVKSKKIIIIIMCRWF